MKCTNKTDCHDITEILLKVALNTMSSFAFNVKPIEFLLKKGHGSFNILRLI
jgi:hypothetical protein